MVAREARLAATFVEVADTLVTDFDVIDLLALLAGRCVDLFDAAAAGLMLADANSKLHIGGSSSDAMRTLELFELQHDEGPCVDSFREEAPISCEELDTARTRWPRFAPAAIAAGFASAYALPMRLRNQTIGSLNLLRTFPGPLNPDDLGAAQALADVATIGILQHRLAAEANLLSGQLESALASRVVIEQAKGVLAEYAATSMDLAFGSLRRYARNHNAHLTDVARAIVARDLRPGAVFDRPLQPRQPPE